jgi:TRAP-type C4-dicarboxylate transport system substrate-binding protein
MTTRGKMKRKMSFVLLIALLFLSAGFFFQNNGRCEEPAGPIELKISHFGPLEWPIHANLLVPWAKKIENLTKGRVKITIFPNQTLGKTSEVYDFVKKGTTDIAVNITEYTQGRFPLSSCLTLPFVTGENAEMASVAFWSLYKKYLQDEFKDVKVLWLFCHSQGQLHTVNKQVKTLEDLKGLKIRVGYPILARALELLGAIPVICPIPEGVNLLKEGKVDGIIVPWEGAQSFGVNDICRYHTIINMYTLPFFAAMNKEKYESLPEDIKKIIDDNSGEEMAAMSGRAIDSADIKAKKIAESRGDFIYTLPKQELERWRKAAMPVGDTWVDTMKEKGLPGLEVLTYTIELFAQIKS